MMSRSLALALLVFLPSVASSQESSAPKDKWEFDVSYDRLRSLALPNAVEPGTSKIYWYMTFKVTNRTGAPRPLSLSGHAQTTVKSQAKLLPALAPETKEELELRTGSKLTNVLEATGELADQESIDLVIVFEGLSNLADKITIRIAGLANCVYRTGNTAWKEVRELAFHFHRLGDEFDVTNKPIRDIGREWIVVDRTKVASK
jgi:hypothetical protein